MADDADHDDEPQDKAPADDDGKGQKDPGKDTKEGDEPGSQERGEQFTEAAGDPLADTLGGTAGRAAEGQAYRTWVKTVRSSGAAAFVGGGHIGVLNISTAAGSGTRGGHAPGPVPPEILEQVTSRYIPVAGYGALVMQLRNSHLLLLRGAPGTGRATTGLRLLAEVTDEVARFSPETDLSSLGEDDLQEGAGYLIELAPGPGSPPPTAVHVDRLRNRLTARECHLVVIAAHDVRHKDAFTGCIADCPLPDPRQVFDRVAEREIRSHPGLDTVLRRASAELAPGAARTPAEMTWLVMRIASAPEGELAAEELARIGAEVLARYVSGWFEPLAGLPASSEADDQVRLAAFRIALAVFNETPFDLVAEAGETLTTRILTARSPRRSPGRPVFARHGEDYVANSRASLIPGTIKFQDSSAPATFVTYDDERLPLAVLSRAWSLHNLRTPMMAWLQALSSDRRPFVRMRAALAIGLLLSWDFSYTFHELIEPWARSTGDDSYRRWVAAVALDEASRNDEVLPVVREILETWCRKGSREQRWTGAMAFGYDLGLRDPSKALKELRKVGCWEEGNLAQPASWAVARIFALGAIDPVLTAASSWLRDDRLAVRELGLLVTLRIADMKVSDLEDMEQTSQEADGRWRRLAGRRRWPLLVAISDEDPAFRDRLADLVWQLPRSAPAQLPALEVLTKWMRAGEKDRSCIGPVSRFLALLGDDQFDRARLVHLVGVLRRDRDEPLPPDIADRYVLAIEKNMHVMDETG